MAQLPPSEQERVLTFARDLAHSPIIAYTPLPPGDPGYLAAQLRVSPEVGEAMEQALAD